MEKKALVLLAEGFEEVETVTPFTYLRRAGIKATTAAIADSLQVKGARGITVIADNLLAELDGSNYDAVIVPGGIHGAANLAACEKTGALLKEMAAAGKLVCAICASPVVVLSPLGLLSGKNFTCYPGMEEKAHEDSRWLEDRVVVDGNIITSRAAGTSGDFAIAIIEYLLGKEMAEKIADTVLS
ncbi:MAG: DJ-1/PfpI family protein [Treponema sp.]|jgi:4-methyl-5(b-hydroxyethyl)-thiazole monophosphate biosynthesis|nr:DJ-1/PfpI family protein [Treponema sp.]